MNPAAPVTSTLIASTRIAVYDRFRADLPESRSTIATDELAPRSTVHVLPGSLTEPQVLHRPKDVVAGSGLSFEPREEHDTEGVPVPASRRQASAHSSPLPSPSLPSFRSQQRAIQMRRLRIPETCQGITPSRTAATSEERRK
jgi:hypothetical protein